MVIVTYNHIFLLKIIGAVCTIHYFCVVHIGEVVAQALNLCVPPALT